MENFTSKKALGVNFFENNGEDFFLSEIGFNDFKYIASQKNTHIQKKNTIHFIINGSGTLKIYNKCYSLSKYNMFFIPPNVNMCYYPDNENKWSYIWWIIVNKVDK